MAEEEQSGFFEGLAADADNAFSSSRRSGNFNSMRAAGSAPLYYPYDLLSVDNPDRENDSGILTWLEFHVFFKQNGGLSSVVEKVKKASSLFSSDETGETPDVDTTETNEETKLTLKEILTYGDDITPNQDVVKNDTRLNRATEKTSDVVALYVPGGLEFSDTLNYEEVGFAGIKNLSSVSATKSSMAMGVLQQVAGKVDKVAGIVGQENLNTGAAVNSQLGVVMNPRKEQMFQGVGFRSFDFAFTFVPRSEEEAATVAEIIKVFRYHAHPEISANSAFFNFPSEFEIKYRTYNTKDGSKGVQDNPILPKLNRCVLEKISTNYSPDDIFYSFKDGMPPKITMSLSFKEAEYITRQHIEQGF